MPGIGSQEADFDPNYNPNFFQVFGRWKHWRIILNVTPLLTLGIVGGAILPVPNAFATTGITASVVSMVIIAACMIYTCDLLLYQSLCIGMRDYGTLSEAVGGKWYRIATEVWLVILILGTLLGSVVQVGETCASGILFINHNAPGALVGGSGRLLMVIGVVLMSAFVFAKSYRSLELFGDAGFITVLVMVIVLIVRSAEEGLPALANGQFNKIGFNNINTFGAAMSTYGFMFYLQPVMMPMLAEMPSGVYGVRLLQWAARIAIGGTAFTLYFCAGFFGAALFGNDTEGNVLENNLGGNGKAQGALNIFMSAYIALGLVPFQYCGSRYLDSLLVQAFPKLNVKKYELLRKVMEAAFSYGIALAIGLAIPADSAQIIAVTGATGVLAVCYTVPIINHYVLYFGKARAQKDPSVLDNIVVPTLDNGGGGTMDLPRLPVHNAKDFADEADGLVVPPNCDSQSSSSDDLKKPPLPETKPLTPQLYGIGSPYIYTTYSPFWKAFHLVVPVLCLVVGGFASVLTLKALADGDD